MLTGPSATAGTYKTVVHRKYTLPQEKRNFDFQIFSHDPGQGSVSLGHVYQVKKLVNTL